MEEERREHEAKMKKMEQEMEQVFDMKVKEKTQKLKDSETDVRRALFYYITRVPGWIARQPYLGYSPFLPWPSTPPCLTPLYLTFFTYLAPFPFV